MKNGRGEVIVVRAVGVVLGFKAEALMLIKPATLAKHVREEIGGIKLNARLGRLNVHFNSRFGTVCGNLNAAAVA